MTGKLPMVEVAKRIVRVFLPPNLLKMKYPIGRAIVSASDEIIEFK